MEKHKFWTEQPFYEFPDLTPTPEEVWARDEMTYIVHQLEHFGIVAIDAEVENLTNDCQAYLTRSEPRIERIMRFIKRQLRESNDLFDLIRSLGREGNKLLEQDSDTAFDFGRLFKTLGYHIIDKMADMGVETEEHSYSYKNQAIAGIYITPEGFDVVAPNETHAYASLTINPAIEDHLTLEDQVEVSGGQAA